MSEGISFTGKGAADVSINKSDTNQPTAPKSKGNDIEFVGKGKMDVDHGSQTTNDPKGKMSDGGPITMTGGKN